MAFSKLTTRFHSQHTLVCLSLPQHYYSDCAPHEHDGVILPSNMMDLLLPNSTRTPSIFLTTDPNERKGNPVIFLNDDWISYPPRGRRGSLSKMDQSAFQNDILWDSVLAKEFPPSASNAATHDHNGTTSRTGDRAIQPDPRRCSREDE